MKNLDHKTKQDISNIIDFEEIEAKVLAFKERERQRLGLADTPTQWHDQNPQEFSQQQRTETTILFSGVTRTHDRLLEAVLTALGYKAKALADPDNESLQYGKEFGNRGQCNPTYYTVGNLIKFLTQLRDEQGLSVEQINRDYILLTVGACGPCRLGMYVTEYRKALRDAGFDGFRVLVFQSAGSMKQSAADAGLVLSPRFFFKIIKAVIVGDVVNAMGYRIRPYESVAGSTDAALEKCRTILCETMKQSKSMLRGLYRCRKELAKVRLNRLQPKPKVSIIGEFWAMTTEGDGNYRLQRFLESEGAECEVQPVTAWLLYSIWEAQYDTRERMMLRRRNVSRSSTVDVRPVKILFLLWLAQFVLRRVFNSCARAIGLKGFHLANMDKLAAISHEYYANELRGGEGHMEVGKLIKTFVNNKAHLVISVKPFGCMPSSGVSDGIQSLVTARYPEANFLSVETSGDGAVNVHSRVQMSLSKARKKAQQEFEEALAKTGLSKEAAQHKLYSNKKLNSPVHYPRHVLAGTASNTLFELG
jgi:predicted nucleotide-binding protein (sugar kinase/HSP70/actin superfamily)